VDILFEHGQLIKRNAVAADPLAQRLRTNAYNLYGNIGFLIRQSFVLAPFLGGFALAGGVMLSVAALRGGAGRELPLLLLLLIHSALVLLWPTTKFRYLVPLLPFAVLVATWLLWQIKPGEVRNLLAGVALALSCFTSVWTFASIPSHTYYYNGGVVTDNFGGQGEILYIEELRHLEAAAAAIRASGPGTVLGPHALYTLARQPLVINSSEYSADVLSHLVRQYAVRYIVAEPELLPRYAGLFSGRPIWQGSKFAVFELAS
jgi:hypothetical protein